MNYFLKKRIFLPLLLFTSKSASIFEFPESSSYISLSLLEGEGTLSYLP